MTGVIYADELSERVRRKLIDKFDGKIAFVKDTALGHKRGIVTKGNRESYSLQQYDSSFLKLYYSDLEKFIGCDLVVSVDF